MGATQDLQQKVCQKYGWSYHYDTDENGHFFVDIVVGININNRYRFISTTTATTQSLTKKQIKEETETVSYIALQALAQQIAIEESKKRCQLSEVFFNRIQIYDSSKSNIWSLFFKNPPQVVGIDTEGNQVSPPVLVQISTLEYTILEAPQNKKLSTNLQRVLQDNNITKVFCDNFSHADKISLGIKLPIDITSGFTQPPIIDIEVLFANLCGSTKVPRGLSKIISMCMPELNVRISKPPGMNQRMKNIGRFSLIEQGKAKPLRGVDDLSEREQQYCALDSWCTLQAYLRMKERMSEG